LIGPLLSTLAALAAVASAAPPVRPAPEAAVPDLVLPRSAAAVDADAPPSVAPIAALPELTPAAVLGPDGRPSPEATVRAIGFDGERFYVNGKTAAELSPAREEGGVSVHTLAHPTDESLAVTLFHSPASLESRERQREAVERLAPLSAAGAGPRLVERGEARVPGRGVVHFLVQEAVRGEPLERRPAAERSGPEVTALFDALERAGLALVNPGPTADFLLRRIVIGETASGGRRAYVVDAAARPVAETAAAAHAGMLKSLLETALGDEAAPAPPQASVAAGPVAPAPDALADSPDVDSGELEALAKRLSEKGTDETILPVAQRLMEALGEAPAKATPRVHDALLAGALEYWQVLATRKTIRHDLASDDYGYRDYYHEPVPLELEYQEHSAGRWRGKQRYSARLDVYRKLLEARPDLAGRRDAEFLSGTFQIGLFGDRTSDHVFLSEQAKIAGALEALALRRPDLLPIGDYARLLRESRRLGVDPKKDPEGAAALGQRRKELEDGFARAAARAPLDELRSALLRFSGAFWTAQAPLEEVVDRLREARPDFAALERDPAMPVLESYKAAARASDPAHPVLHGLTTGVVDRQTLELAVRAAESGWAAYRKSLRGADPAKAKQFYIDVFALGQVMDSQSAFGPRTAEPEALMAEARRVGQAYLPGDQALETALYRIEKDLSRSPRHMRKAAQAALLRRFAGLDADGPKPFPHGDPRMTRTPYDLKHRIVLDELAKDIPVLLKDFDVGAPSNIAGVALAGSWAEGGADASSDLNLYLLTREGRERTAEFIEALRKHAARRQWPAIRIEAADVMDANDPRVEVLRRSVPTYVYSLDQTLAAPVPVDDPYSGPLSWLRQRGERKWRRRLRAALEARLR